VGALRHSQSLAIFEKGSTLPALARIRWILRELAGSISSSDHEATQHVPAGGSRLTLLIRARSNILFSEAVPAVQVANAWKKRTPHRTLYAEVASVATSENKFHNLPSVLPW